jgi:hypothetical protein
MNSAFRSSAVRARNELFEFVLTHAARNRLADFLEIGKVPQVRKITALPGLDRLHGTIVAFEQNALAVWFFHQGKPVAIRSQTGEPLDKIKLAHLLERGEACNFLIAQPHLARPAATGRAASAFVKNRHALEWPVGRR